MSSTPRSPDDPHRARRAAPLILAGLLVLVAGAVAAVLVAVRAGPFIQDWMFDNAPSGVACADLPDRATVERALSERTDLVRRIESVGTQPGDVTVRPDAERCGTDDHTEILITFPSHSERQRIEAILRDSGFGDVPVSLRNV